MQSTFLAETAKCLYDRYGRDISSLTIVLPSVRARLFFTEELSHLTDKPLWSPQYMSMDDIMREASSFSVGEKVRMITDLYKVYSEYHDEPFDKFYFWGEMLLGDFDLIDKYMIDADMLFRNIYDLKVLEADLSYLTPEMRRIISTFWSHFKDEESLSEEKRKFLSIWKTLAAVYHGLRKRLADAGEVYSGMMYRSAAENVKDGSAGIDLSRRYVFVGFNALSESEKCVIKYLETNAAACEFCWDYDSYYVGNRDQEAGRFLREDISMFHPTYDITTDNFLSVKKKISSISTVSNVLQCKYAATVLREISPSLTFDKQTAIVLTDESLLMPLLHSLPPEIADNINVTMGYPLRQTTAYAFVERLLELQRNRRHGKGGESFYHVDVTGILSHPYIEEIDGKSASRLYAKVMEGRYIRVEESFFDEDPLLRRIFTAAGDWRSLAEYLMDVLRAVSERFAASEERSLRLAYMSIISDNLSQVNNSLKDCDVDITNSIYASLVKRHLQTVRIPFSGEPLKGLQVMGILETRNLDFKNVIILSMNDDNFPGDMSGASSFIPYNLRAAYGLPTPEHHEGVYAYYFYRLVQRAERVDMLYCSHADEKTTGECSRYIYQLMYESPYPIERVNVGVDINVDMPAPISVAKSGRTLDVLNAYLDADGGRILSPTALSRYVACPLQFYFASVAGIDERDELTEEVDNPMFGTIVHAAMQKLYEPLEGVAHPSKQLEAIIRSGAVERAVEQAINENYLKMPEADASDYGGDLILVHDIATRYIKHGIIPYDMAHDAFAVMKVEEKIAGRFDLGDGRNVSIGGRADRIDSLDDGTLRVVDYKTGAQHSEIDSLESLFEGEGRTKVGNILQTLIYSMIISHSFGRNVRPALYFVRYMQHRTDFSPAIVDKSADGAEIDYGSYAVEFERSLRCKLAELFDASTPFVQCDASEAESTCKYCQYKTICKR